MASETGHAPEAVGEAGARNESKLRGGRAGPIRWTAGLIVRLCIWYALLTPLLRCPARLADLNESSSSVCKPYLIARSYVEPHVLPHYHTYAAPYVDRARPYVTVLNEQVYTPTVTVAKQGYDRYGAPAWDQARKYARRQWDAQVIPQLQSAQGHVNGMYKTQIEPHIQRGRAAVLPYYEQANKALLKVYWDYVFPYYARSRPFIGKTYTSGQDMLATTVLPYAQGTWSSVIYFANSKVLPRITGLYSENVEPQLVKIGHRLASYKEGKTLRGALDEFNGHSEPAASTTSSEPVETSHLYTTSTVNPAPETSTAQTVSQTLSPTEQAAQARERINSDLQRWQEKFTASTDKAVEDLDERLEVMIQRHIESGASEQGGNLVAALETAIENELSAVKQRINTLAESLPFEDTPIDEEHAQNELLDDIRRAAVSIRERAHTLREWYNSFNDELERRVSGAIDSTLGILDNVRDLGLQEIGIRWAWMDGVTYTDWENYHALKSRLEGWRDEIRDVGMQHRTVEVARTLTSQILSYGMDAAESSAKELARLKDVGKWKIAAREASDNFDTRSDPPPTWPRPGSESDSAEGDITEEGDIRSQPPVDVTDTAFATQSSPAPTGEADAVSQDADVPIADEQTLKADEEDSPNQEPRSVALTPTSSAGVESYGSNTEGQINRSIRDSTRGAWGVAAEEVTPERVLIFQNSSDRDKGRLDRGQFSDDMQSLVGNGGDRHAQATSAASDALLVPSPGAGAEENAGLGSDQYCHALSAASRAVLDARESPGPATKCCDDTSSVTSSRLNKGETRPTDAQPSAAPTAIPSRDPHHVLSAEVVRESEATSTAKVGASSAHRLTNEGT